MSLSAPFRSWLIKLISRLPSDALRKLESFLALSQGKGWGSGSVRFESRLAVTSFNKRSNLPPIVFDVGANIGDYTEGILEVCSSAKIFAFEPSLEAFHQLKRRYTEMSNIETLNLAVGASTTQTTLYSDRPGSVFASLTRRGLDYHNVVFDFAEEVQQVSLDDFCRNEEIFPDIIKIDVEGHELDVLKGATQVLQYCSVVQFEFGSCNIDSRTYFKDLWVILKGFKFRIHRISASGLQEIRKYSETDEHFRTTNFLATKEL